MSDEDETPSFGVGDVVWVKLGVQWWPGEICPENQVPKEVISSHKKRPVAIVKFFHEDTYEFVKNPNHLLQYNHPKKTEFIRKGMDIFRQNNNKYMNKFPSDIQTAEEITGGDVNILSRAEFAPAKKLNYSTIFGDQTKKTKKGKTAQNKNDNLTQTPQRGRRRKSQAKSSTTTYSSSQHLMNVDKNHESRIIPQTTIQTSPNASPGTYKCHLCDFSSTRQNVIVLHTKIHSGQSTPLISKKPKEPKSILKKQQPINDVSNITEESILIEDSDSDLAEYEQNKSKKSNDKSTEIHDNHSHNKRVRNEKSKSIPATVTSKCSSRSKKSSSHEYTLDAIELDDSLSDDSNSLLKAQKKTETKDELRSKLLADWSDDDDEDDDLDDSENMSKKEKSKKIGKSSKEQQSTSHENYNENNSIRAPTRLEMPIRLSSDLAAIVQDSSRFDSEELAELIKQSNLSSSSSTSSINLDTQQMMTKVKLMTAAAISNTTSSSTPKYRNIPKKDRRDIVLKDFDSSSSDIANENKSPAKQIVVQSENIVAIEQQEIKENVNETQTDVKEISNSDEKMLSNNEFSQKHEKVTKLLDDVTTNTTIESNELESEKRIEDEVHSQTILENIEKEHLITDKDHEKENDQIDHQGINESIEEIMITSDDNSNKIEKEVSSPHRKPRFSFEKQKENEKEKDNQKQQTETTAANNNNAANKVSISCFDFREEEDDEEDFLASISKLKKKYLSPDKSRDHSIDDNKDQQQQSPENETNEKIELEKKDKQLSDDIENLLNSTQLPDIVGAGTNNNCEPSSSSSSSSIMLHQEVRTLPPKERGKRIFKSRNRTRYEESTTTALSNNALSSTIAISNYSSSPLTTVQNIEVQPQEQFKDLSPKKSSNRSKSTESLQKITISTTGDHEEEINKDKDSNVNEEIINEGKDSNVNEGINEGKDSIVNEEKINEDKDSIVNEEKINEDKDSIVNEEEIIVEEENLKDDVIENETDNEITITKDKDSEIIEEDNAICETNSQSNEDSSENSENIESPPYEKTTENFESVAILSEVENDEDKTCQLEKAEEIKSEVIITENVITEEIEEIKSGVINTENVITEETQEAKSEVIATENIITEEAEIEEEKLETIAAKEAEEEKNLEITAEETTIVSELQENTQQMVMEEIPKETYDESKNLSSENLNQNKENVSQILVEEIIKKTYDESRNLSPVSLYQSRENESQENVPEMMIEEIPKETYDESRNLSLISLSQSRENELAVAETLISIPSKLNEMESRKSKQKLLMQQENDKNLSMSECDTIVIVQSEEISKKEDRIEQENFIIPRVMSPLIKETEVAEQQIEEEKPMPQPSSQRKRRAHMKITPRKRIIQESPLEPVIIQQIQNQSIERVVIPDKSVKIIFTSPEDKAKTSKQNEERVSPDTTVTQQKEEKTDILSSERSLSLSDVTQTSTEQSSSEDNFVEKYIKDAMMFVNDDSPIQNQDDIGKISKNESEVVTEEKQNITSTTSVKNQLNEENNVKDNEKKESIKQNETEDNALKLTGKQITEILDLRSMGMRADTPKNDIDDNVSSTVTIKLMKTDKTTKDTDLKSKNDPEKVITEKPEKIPETVAVEMATTETVTTTTSKTNIKIIEKSNEEMQSTKQEVPKIIESSTNEEIVCIFGTTETIKNNLKASRRRSKELTNLLQSVDIGAQTGKRSKSPVSESKITEMPREILRSDHVSVNLEIDDQNQKKLKQQQSLPTKEFSNVRSFRPRKAKENIDARIRASLSPPLPADNLTVTQKTSTSTYSELIQAQKLTSLKDVIKTSKIELEHRLSQSNEQKPNEDKNQQSDKEQEQTCPEIVQQVVESTSFEIAKSEKASTINIEKHSKVQPQIIVIESKPQQKLVENLKNKSQNENKSNLIIIDKSTKIDSTKEKEIKKMIPEIISRNETSAKAPVKLQHQPLQQQQQLQRQRKQSTEVSQMKTTSGEYLLEQPQKQQSKPEQIILTTKIDPKTTNSSNTSDGHLLLGNKQKVISNVVIVENKQETVRVPKKRKPAFDDIEDIPSFVIPKRPVISVTSSSPTIDQQQQLQQQKQSPQPQQQLQKQQQHKGESSLKKIEKIFVPPATEIIEIQQQKTQQQHKGESSLIVEKVVVPPPATEIIEIQHQSQQSQQQQKIICKTIDDATMFDINNLPILLTNESVLHTGDGNMNQVHIVITPHSNPTSTAAATITALPVTESMPQSLLSSSSMASSSTIATVMPPSNKNSVTKKKTIKQQSNVTGSQSGAEVSHQKSGKSKQAAKVLIQDEPKQIGIDGKGNKFVIVRSENGAKMIIQPDTSPKIKRKDIQVHSSVKSLTTTTTTTTTTTAKSMKTTTTSRRKSQSPTVSQQQLSYQHQSSSAINSNKNIGTSEKTSVISSQIISPTTGKHILSKASGGPSLPVGTDSNLVITSKGNVYTSNTKNVSTTSNLSNNKTIDSRNTQTSVTATQIYNISPTATSAAASNLTRRLSRQGTTLQPLTGDRIGRQQINVEEPPKVIIQPKTMVDEICSPQPQAQHILQQQLEPGEISASEAAELTSRFGFIEVQQVQSPPPQIEPINTPTTIINKKFETVAPTPPISTKHVQQQHKTSRKSKNKVEDMSMTSINVTEVPPLTTLIGDSQQLSQPQQQHQQQQQQQHQQQQHQQQPSRSAVKRKSVSSTSQAAQQQSTQTSGKQAKRISTPTPIPSPEKVTGNSPSAVASTSTNLNKVDDKQMQIDDSRNLLAVTGESFGGPPGSFYLCTSEEDGYVPVDNVPLFLDANNRLLPFQSETQTILEEGTITLQDGQIIMEAGDNNEQILTDLGLAGGGDQFVINTNDGQQMILDQQTMLAMSNQGPDGQLYITINGQSLIITPDILTTNNQSGDLSGTILLSEGIDGQITASNPDILAAALAGTEVYHQDQLLQIDNGNVLQIGNSNGVQIVEQGIAFQPINPPVTAQTSETNAILTQPPIMSTLEVPSSKKKTKLDMSLVTRRNETGLIGQNLEDSLAVIGVTTQASSVPSSLNLPITVTNPAIAPKSTSNPISLSGIYPSVSGLSHGSQISPSLSIANEQELVAAGYELFTTSSIDSHQTGFVSCTENSIKTKNTVNEIILQQTSSSASEHKQSNDEEEIVMTDFVGNTNDAGLNVSVSGDHHHHHPHHHHSNEFVVHNIEQQQQQQQSQHHHHHNQQINSGNFDDSTSNR